MSCAISQNAPPVLTGTLSPRSEKRWSLMPPQENLLTFVEVDRMPDALVGLTAANCVVVW